MPYFQKCTFISKWYIKLSLFTDAKLWVALGNTSLFYVCFYIVTVFFQSILKENSKIVLDRSRCVRYFLLTRGVF